MPLAIVYSRAGCGVEAPLVTIEVHLSNGLPSLSIVGLPETAVKESKDRVRSAIINTKFDFPTRRITINLAPADLPKRDGGRFDLAIAIGILVASEQLPAVAISETEFAGELALGGKLREVRGILPFAFATSKTKRNLILPKFNADEAALIDNLQVFPAECLFDVCAHLTGERSILVHKPDHSLRSASFDLDLAEVRGQQQAKRVLEIAASGRHSILMKGSPGVGKTMLASRLPGILPVLSDDEAIETAAIYSISGKGIAYEKWHQRPFRSPHHTASSVALVGGGNPPKPGEVSLAHNGVLFLDEFPEFNRHVLEVLREPLESGSVIISRASYQAQFPACFQLVAAMNPCPCGYLGDLDGRCRCTPKQIQQYSARISGPLLDRIDLHFTMANLPPGIFLDDAISVETSAQVKSRVSKVYRIQIQRQGKINAALVGNEIQTICKLDAPSQKLLENAMHKFGFSARSYQRIRKIARTIADMDNSVTIGYEHLQEALAYRA